MSALTRSTRSGWITCWRGIRRTNFVTRQAAGSGGTVAMGAESLSAKQPRADIGPLDGYSVSRDGRPAGVERGQREGCERIGPAGLRTLLLERKRQEMTRRNDAI